MSLDGLCSIKFPSLFISCQIQSSENHNNYYNAQLNENAADHERKEEECNIICRMCTLHKKAKVMLFYNTHLPTLTMPTLDRHSSRVVGGSTSSWRVRSRSCCRPWGERTTSSSDFPIYSRRWILYGYYAYTVGWYL